MDRNLTPKQIVKEDKNAIYLGNLYTVEDDLVLPTKGKLGSKIRWHSDNQHLISNTGKVIRPDYGKGNRKTILTATVIYGEEFCTRQFEVTVLEKEPDFNIVGVKETNLKCKLGVVPEMPSVVIIEKEDGTFGTSEVEWDAIEPESCAKEGILKINGKVHGTDIKATANIVITNIRTDDNNSIPEITTAPFNLDEVELMDDIFTPNKDRAENFLLLVDDDRMLYNFRDVASLDKKGAKPMLGWDAPECKLKGHTTGHYLSALAHAYRSSGDQRFKGKIDYMVSELGKCQEAMEASGKFNYGFLSAYSEEQFDKLEEYTPYPQIWAPYYTLHKIIAGLLDCYELGKNDRALYICKKLGTWVHNRLKRLSKEQLNKMWSMYIAGEYGGMNEVMARLYSITGNEDYLKAAKFFDNEKLFIPMQNNINTLGGMHANQHIPQIIGALRIYAETKDVKYYNIANNFWEMVTEHHIYSIGGVGEGEMFKSPDKIGSFITDKTAETCATYNMLKLTKALFCYKPAVKYMDYYEKALYNHILASQDQSGPVGGSTYFMPLCPGSKKDYDTDSNSCCHGTGMENHVKYQECIYFYDEDTLYVNLYIPSKLDWAQKGVTIIQSGDYLSNNSVFIKIMGNAELNIKLRRPYWAREGFTLKINDKAIQIDVQPGDYATLSREWREGDSIEIDIPFTFRLERTPDIQNLVSIMYGPLVMVARSNNTGYIELDVDEKSINKKIRKTENPLKFELEDLVLVPNYTAWDFPYHTYFKVK